MRSGLQALSEANGTMTDPPLRVGPVFTRFALDRRLSPSHAPLRSCCSPALGLKRNFHDVTGRPEASNYDRDRAPGSLFSFGIHLDRKHHKQLAGTYTVGLARRVWGLPLVRLIDQMTIVVIFFPLLCCSSLRVALGGY